MSAKKPKTPKPDKAIMAQLEAENFLEPPPAGKPKLREPLVGKIGPDDPTTAQIIR